MTTTQSPPTIYNLPTQPLYLAMPALTAHMQRELPNECVGLLWSDGTITALINQARSPSRFSVGGTQMVDAIASVDPEVKTLVGLYHSHPFSTLDLSSTDRDQLRIQFASDVDVPWLIIIPALTYHSGYSWWWWDMNLRSLRGDIHAD